MKNRGTHPVDEEVEQVGTGDGAAQPLDLPPQLVLPFHVCLASPVAVEVCEAIGDEKQVGPHIVGHVGDLQHLCNELAQEGSGVEPDGLVGPQSELTVREQPAEKDVVNTECFECVHTVQECEM